MELLKYASMLIVSSFRVSGLFPEIARRHMWLSPIFWVSLWTAWRLRVTR